MKICKSNQKRSTGCWISIDFLYNNILILFQNYPIKNFWLDKKNGLILPFSLPQSHSEKHKFSITEFAPPKTEMLKLVYNSGLSIYFDWVSTHFCGKYALPAPQILCVWGKQEISNKPCFRFSLSSAQRIKQFTQSLLPQISITVQIV